jgi:aryl-alcohol dehydrogenase-like predicted oxidoreductase
MAAMEGTRQEQLGFQLDEAFGPGPGSSVSRRTVRALLSLPGVTSVLVGMRRAPYVEDVVGAFREPPAGAP